MEKAYPENKDVTPLFSDLYTAAKEKNHRVGSIGVGIPFVFSDRLPLTWQLRLLSDDGDFLPTLPYSLRMNSFCCQGRVSLFTDRKSVICVTCGKIQPATVSSDPLSLLNGELRPATLSHLEQAISFLWPQLDVFQCVIASEALVLDIETVHAKLVQDEAWVNKLRKKIERRNK